MPRLPHLGPKQPVQPADQHAFRCTCRALRDASTPWVTALALSPLSDQLHCWSWGLGSEKALDVEGWWADMADRDAKQLKLFPRAAKLTSLTWLMEDAGAPVVERPAAASHGRDRDRGWRGRGGWMPVDADSDDEDESGHSYGYGSDSDSEDSEDAHDDMNQRFVKLRKVAAARDRLPAFLLTRSAATRLRSLTVFKFKDQPVGACRPRVWAVGSRVHGSGGIGRGRYEWVKRKIRRRHGVCATAATVKCSSCRERAWRLTVALLALLRHSHMPCCLPRPC